MKIRSLLFVALLATISAGFNTAKAQQPGAVTDTVIMGNSYANEVYYSLADGKQGAVARNQWDVAFRTAILSASIITNDGAGVMLYTWPNGAAEDWANVDTTGLSTWVPLYNSLTDWETGAFNVNSKGQMDYGWGVYNLVTHNLAGDSIYIVKLRNGSLRKLWIESKASAANIYTFKFASLSGTDEQEITLDCNLYTSKNFIGYSLSDNKIVDFEPVASAKWDLLFTKYMGLSGTTPYNVTGVLSNYKTGVAYYRPVASDFIAYKPDDLKQVREGIGYQWKSFTGTGYKIVDSAIYFIQDRNNMIYKLIFKDFAGSSTGRIVFQKEKLGTVPIISRENAMLNAVVYPNPVKDVMNLVINPGNSPKVKLSLMSTTGSVLFSGSYTLPGSQLTTLPVALPKLSNGIYLLNIQAGHDQFTRKIVINN